jgi:hypothetical protein
MTLVGTVADLACDDLRDLGYTDFITAADLGLVLEYIMCKKYFPCLFDETS